VTEADGVAEVDGVPDVCGLEVPPGDVGGVVVCEGEGEVPEDGLEPLISK